LISMSRRAEFIQPNDVRGRFVPPADIDSGASPMI
jgi:hypothetical protein